MAPPGEEPKLSKEQRMARAASATPEELRLLVHDRSRDVLLALLDNPYFDEGLLQLLLHRNDLPGEVIEAVAARRDWMKSYPVRLRLASHPHAPRLLALSLVRQLFLFDLVKISLLPSTPAEIRRIAEESIIARLPQLALGQKLSLARQGPGRVAAALLAEGLELTIPLALNNAFLTEAQLLKVLARDDLPPAVPSGVAAHPRWSSVYSVRMALVRHPLTPLSRVLAFIPDLTLGDLEVLSGARSISPSLKEYIRSEVALRRRRSKCRPEQGAD